MSQFRSKAAFDVGFRKGIVDSSVTDVAKCRIPRIQAVAPWSRVGMQTIVNKALTGPGRISIAVGSGFAASGERTREITDAAVDSKSRTHTADTGTRSRLWNLVAGFRLAAGKRQYQAHCSLFAPTLLGLLTRGPGRDLMELGWRYGQ